MGNKISKSEREHREIVKEQKIQEVKHDLTVKKPESVSDAVFNTVRIAQLDRKDSPLNKTDLIAIVLKIKREEDAMGVIYQTMTVKDLRALIRLLVYQKAADAPRGSTTVKLLT